MTKVQFYDRVDDRKLRFAVIVTKADGHWVFCKHREMQHAGDARGTSGTGRRYPDHSET